MILAGHEVARPGHEILVVQLSGPMMSPIRALILYLLALDEILLDPLQPLLRHVIQNG